MYDQYGENKLSKQLRWIVGQEELQQLLLICINEVKQSTLTCKMPDFTDSRFNLDYTLSLQEEAVQVAQMDCGSGGVVEASPDLHVLGGAKQIQV